MRKVGVWIDHTKAVVAVIENGNESLETVESNVGRHAGPSGGSGNSTPWGPKAPNDEHKRERKYEQHLVRYYRDVIKHLGQPAQLMLIGPARAKQELKAELEKSQLKDVPTAVETTDEMTDAQVMAHLRAFEMKNGDES
jgi:hypothetical protein